MSDVSRSSRGGDHKNDISNINAPKQLQKGLFKLRVMQFNQRSSWTKITLKPGEMKSNMESLVVQAKYPDVVAMQEVSAKQWNSCQPAAKGKKSKVVKGMLGELVNELGYKAIWRKTCGNAKKGETIGMFYNPNRLHLVDYGLLDAVKKYDAAGVPHVFDRQPLFALFRLKLPNGTLGQHVAVVTFHLACTGRKEKLEVAWLGATLKTSKMPACLLRIVSGDFNCLSGDSQWTNFVDNTKTADKADDYMHALPAGVSTMFGGVEKKRGHDNVLMLREQMRQYGAVAKVLGSGQWQKYATDGEMGLSDHCPVMTTLEFDLSEALSRSESEEESIQTFLKHLKGFREKGKEDVVGEDFRMRVDAPKMSSSSPSPSKQSPKQSTRRSTRRHQPQD